MAKITAKIRKAVGEIRRLPDLEALLEPQPHLGQVGDPRTPDQREDRQRGQRQHQCPPEPAPAPRPPPRAARSAPPGRRSAAAPAPGPRSAPASARRERPAPGSRCYTPPPPAPAQQPDHHRRPRQKRQRPVAIIRRRLFLGAGASARFRTSIRPMSHRITPPANTTGKARTAPPRRKTAIALQEATAAAPPASPRP